MSSSSSSEESSADGKSRLVSATTTRKSWCAHSKLKDELAQWFVHEAQSRFVDNKALKEALRIYRVMHPNEYANSISFKASNGWLARFKKRKHLRESTTRTRALSAASDTPLEAQLAVAAAGLKVTIAPASAADKKPPAHTAAVREPPVPATLAKSRTRLDSLKGQVRDVALLVAQLVEGQSQLLHRFQAPQTGDPSERNIKHSLSAATNSTASQAFS